MIRLGIICPSEIAFRRFMPALKFIPEIQFAGLGVCTAQERFGDRLPPQETVSEILQQEQAKAQNFIDNFGGKIFPGYEALVRSTEIDAVYLPLPPALHYRWAKLALECGKHVLVEKPSTLAAADTTELCRIASQNHLALHENYMFVFHEQLAAVQNIVDSGELGDIRLYRIDFGFPRRQANDFRYNRFLGGGALIDAGGYTIRYADMLLGGQGRIVCAQMNGQSPFEVDMFGSGTMVSPQGTTVQFAFGMDNDYRCDLNIWGSRGSLSSGRILTAPAAFVPRVTVRLNQQDEVRDLPADDAFQKSIRFFASCIADAQIRANHYQTLIRQAQLVDDFRNMGAFHEKM